MFMYLFKCFTEKFALINVKIDFNDTVLVLENVNNIKSMYFIIYLYVHK